MSDQTPQSPAPSQQPEGNWWKRKSRFKKVLWSCAAVFVALVAIGIAMPAEDEANDSAPPAEVVTVTETEAATIETEPVETEAETVETETPTPPSESSNKATDDNEPHVGKRGTVIVDTLTWRVLSVRQANELGGEFSRETPDGVYVVVKARVTNGKSESVTINSDIAELEVAGNKYASDSDGTIAVQFSGDEETFFLKDLGPGVSTQGTIVFDVPRSALNKVMEICFGELGFGSTKGCIRLN